MTQSALLRCATALCLASLLCACGDDGGGEDDTGAGSGGAGSADEPCTIPDGSGADVSLRADVMPILSLSCVSAACHDSSKASDLYLGPKCKWSTASSQCEFPADPSDPDALTDAAVAEVIANLVGVPSTTTSSTQRVVSGDPAASFLMEKVTGLHNAADHTDCTPQQTGAAEPCGDDMPPIGEALCKQAGGAERVDTLARWIAQGAQNN